MKKMIALLLVSLVILGSVVSALAYDEEITFQSIPWELSHKEAQKAFKKAFGKSASGYKSLMKGIEAYMRTAIKVENGQVELVYEPVKIDVDVATIKEKIAGYSTENVVFGFFCPEKNKATLQEITVNFKTTDIQEVAEKAEVLIEYYTEIYGEHYSFEQGFGPCACWIGAEQTYVCVLCADHSLSVAYGKTTITED